MLWHQENCVAGIKPLNKREKQVLRMVFESWREHTVESHASRFRKKLALEQRGTLQLLVSCQGTKYVFRSLVH